MEYQLNGYSSDKVLHFFEEISAIPRGSGNEEEISNFLVSFAKARDLEVLQDDHFNVVIRKDATKGAEDKPRLTLQGHMDMVCEKLPGSAHDFITQGIELLVEDGFLTANGTTLGADDGVAVALMLAVLDDDDLPHPPLECVFTVSEEIGLLGADWIPPTWITGNALINLDSEEEGVATVSSAGGVRYEISRPMKRHFGRGFLINIHMEGLLGGHSGVEIHLGHTNANVLMARTLLTLLSADGYAQIVNFNGGSLDNAIPRDCDASILYHTSTAADLAMNLLEEMRTNFHQEIDPVEPDFKFNVSYMEDVDVKAFSHEKSLDFIKAIFTTPDGVIKRDPRNNFIIASNNIGLVRTDEEGASFVCLARSSMESMWLYTMQRIHASAEAYGFEDKIVSTYPGWAYKEDSPIRETILASYRKLYGAEMRVEAMHAGLETGLLVAALPELDAISIGPTLIDVHTPNERMEIASLDRTYDLLLDVISSLTK